MRKVLRSFLPIFVVFALTVMPIVQAAVYHDYYYPTYNEGGITKIKGSVYNMVADRYTGIIRFDCDAYGLNPYESEVSAWMIQRWTASGGEWTTIKVYVYLTGLMGAAGLGYGKLTLTLKAWWKEVRWSGAEGTYASDSKIFEVGSDKWFGNQLETIEISFYNPWKSGRDDDGSVYVLKMGLFVEGYARGGWFIWISGQAYLRFHTYGSETCYIKVDHFKVTRST